VLVGNSPHAVVLSQRLLARGYNVPPAIFPGVPENQARLRFFINSRHNRQQIEGVLDATAAELVEIRQGPSFVKMVSEQFKQSPG
jgi:7-keto-8-aminopelargonate synthetase-like enzyme